ncbi:MAG: hypothetical protein KGL39_50165 [Patescibacteria group bacterium]|nr:hypothetical protein [Patescibacteria group bacterium]
MKTFIQIILTLTLTICAAQARVRTTFSAAQLQVMQEEMDSLIPPDPGTNKFGIHTNTVPIVKKYDYTLQTLGSNDAPTLQFVSVNQSNNTIALVANCWSNDVCYLEHCTDLAPADWFDSVTNGQTICVTNALCYLEAEPVTGGDWFIVQQVYNGDVASLNEVDYYYRLWQQPPVDLNWHIVCPMTNGMVLSLTNQYAHDCFRLRTIELRYFFQFLPAPGSSMPYLASVMSLWTFSYTNFADVFIITNTAAVWPVYSNELVSVYYDPAVTNIGYAWPCAIVYVVAKDGSSISTNTVYMDGTYSITVFEISMLAPDRTKMPGNPCDSLYLSATCGCCNTNLPAQPPGGTNSPGITLPTDDGPPQINPPALGDTPSIPIPTGPAAGGDGPHGGTVGYPGNWNPRTGRFDSCPIERFKDGSWWPDWLHN